MSCRRKEPHSIKVYNKLLGIDGKHIITKFEPRDECKRNKTVATAGGLNNFTKVMKRMSYGFSSLKRMRKMSSLLGFSRIAKRNLNLKEIKE